MRSSVRVLFLSSVGWMVSIGMTERKGERNKMNELMGGGKSIELGWKLVTINSVLTLSLTKRQTLDESYLYLEAIVILSVK